VEVVNNLLNCFAKLNHAPVRHYTHLPLPVESPDQRLNRLERILKTM
jgi:hypothetical protein